MTPSPGIRLPLRSETGTEFKGHIGHIRVT